MELPHFHGPAEARQRRAAPVAPQRRAKARSLRILLVDDHEDVRSTTAAALEDSGHRVFQAADKEGVSPAVMADRMAEERMRSVGRLAAIRL